MTSSVLYAREGRVATITLNDPERRNGLSPEVIGDLLAALGRLASDEGVRCAVLTGAGSSFSAGGNPKRMLQPGLYPDMSPARIRRHYQEGIQRIPLAFEALDIPVVAAVNGPAVGAGCDLACMCDLRIASRAATFSSSFVKLGLVPGDGGAWLLPRVIGFAAASEMILTGEPIDAQRALGLGLVSAVTEPEDLPALARGHAERIAANPPHAVQLAKRLLREAGRLSLPEALELSAAYQAMCHKTEDHREAVTAFLERREPRFNNR